MIENTLTVKSTPLENYKQKQLDTVAVSLQKQKTSREEVFFENDRMTLSFSSESIITYDSSMSLKGTQGDMYNVLKDLVLNIFKNQNVGYRITTDVQEINIQELSSEEAAELVDDDGYFGVEQTSDRIVDFATGIAGNDPARLDTIKQGVEKGFQEALDAFGGWLPEISYDTYDAVFKKLDDWADGNHSHSMKT
ncbi:hypothetical protein DGMP_12710 [Desulfomarina profundi]|uniref:DUF5610 domain-containing protein n=1 Tax=Desulfomarina profundi TaxID=2772557 RepID=A0A8D5FKB8_9BACT|nr:hypothetical protein [Desulfomarina profundi]BCL60578.1 hypothetical protein DGMP_12710 [Desulfomarina profundi]